jgi:glycosyltransferase involved in cell wall biosynthesis
MDPEKKTPVVSVVIPAYNAEVYLRRTVDSILCQTYKRLEIIIVDDGSTDKTLDIAEEYAAGDSRVEVISTPNQGVAAARNLGIDRATGAFIAFLDADDLWHPTKIEKQLATLSSRGPDWGAVYTLHRVIDQIDQVTQDGPVFTASGFVLGQHLVLKFIRNGSTLLVRREAAIAVNGFDPTYAARAIGGCEDLDFELRIAACYKMDVVPEMLVGYRRYFGNMSSNKVRMGQSLIAVTEKCLLDNPGLTAETRSYAILAAHQYGFRNFSNGRDLGRALTSLAIVARHNPISACVTLSGVVFYYFPRKVLRWLLKKIGVKRSPFQPLPRKYLEMDPTEQSPDRPSCRARRRFDFLRRMDSVYESERMEAKFEAMRQAAPPAVQRQSGW